MFYLIGQTVGQLQRLQGTGGRGPGNEVQISHQQQYLPQCPFMLERIIRNLEFNSEMKFGGTLVLKEFYYVSLLLPVYI